MNFYRGLRRLTFVVWCVTSVLFLFMAVQGRWDDGAQVGFAIGIVAMWAAFYWFVVFVVRWVWLGFVTKDEQRG